ncbi:poly [ADP-ribose] polymerase 2-like [Homarus americanus]|uniref:poly [ADP-ribose] polymerase 2-like n=1 Tax=Homarus americanus TaxID=6706 RepID=UPI001C46C75D|nr:poly [ADP-ribose] polymerase 2-like [Homarus americanus]
MAVKAEPEVNDAQTVEQKATVSKRGEKRGIKVEEEIKEEYDVQKPSTSNGTRAKGTKNKSKAPKKAVKEETPEEPSAGKVPGGKKAIAKGKKGEKGSNTSSEGKENINSNNIQIESSIKSGAERVVILKGRAPVDALCPIANHSHIYDEGDDIWDCMLNQVIKVFESHYCYVECKLEIRVRALIELICDVRAMEATVVEMKYDAKKAPLGKLTTEQIKAGYLALKRIDDLTKSGNYKQMELVHACNDFYTRVPHYFGMKVPPLIRTRNEIQEKMALLEALGDIQAAMSFLDQAIDINIHPADQHYEGLKCDITPLEKNSDDFKVKTITVLREEAAIQIGFVVVVYILNTKTFSIQGKGSFSDFVQIENSCKTMMMVVMMTKSLQSDGTLVPMGPGEQTEIKNSRGYTLMYNEYIVYDPAQVRTRFLLKIKFNFKY